MILPMTSLILRAMWETTTSATLVMVAPLSMLIPSGNGDSIVNADTILFPDDPGAGCSPDNDVLAVLCGFSELLPWQHHNESLQR